MSDIRSLREIEGIRVRRVDEAEDELRRAQYRQRQAEDALKQAHAELDDYKQRLPVLIEQLYVDCIHHLVSREFVQDKVYDETRLRSKVEDYKAKVIEATKNLQLARQASDEAQGRLNKERLKLDALKEMILSERKKIQIAIARTEAKVLDDLAGSKYVRALRQSA
jgi:flagellar biosynthesis chaperone FliJ